MDPDLVVRAVCYQHVLLLRVMRKSEIVDGSAHAKCRAAGTTTLWTAGRRRGMHEETANELALLGEYLNSVVATLADIDESVCRDVDAVKRGRELLLIRRRTRFPVVRRRRIIVDLAQRNAVPAPATLECTTFHVVHQDALLIHDVQLFGVLVQIEKENSSWKSIGVLIVLLQRLRLLPWRSSWSAMTKLPEKLPIAGKFLDAVPSGASSEPDVSFFIHKDRVFCAGARPFYSFGRPARHVARASPALDKIARGIEFQYCRRGFATVCAWRSCCCPRLIGVDVPRTVEHPDVVVLIRNHHGNPLHEPFVWQRLGPSGIDFIHWRVLRSHRRNNYENQEAGKPDRYGRRIVPPISNPHHMFLRLMCTQDRRATARSLVDETTGCQC